ncbi:hypothetical protein Clacol_009876 [Clathrus columnatus]|uniref:Protein kinase domain-containing protein n=1 Tax=Clathrus columnatus TaxID=1419009 RepID=A0AAV5ASF6_9AGAM|nr:hypothetical protein Clacol_009876 [Clathrus columnatus]
MATVTPIVRKKRNFKQLALDVSASNSISTPSQPPPIPPRLAPAAVPGMTGSSVKKKPPAMDLSKSKVIKDNGNDSGVEISSSSDFLTVSASPSSTPSTGSMNPKSNYHHLTEQIATFDMNSEKKLDIKPEDLKELAELGQGNGGSVKKVEHVPTGTIMAKKIVLIDAKPSVRKQILRELQIMHDCHSAHIISFYGAFVVDPNICICMEFMDKGSLDGIYKKHGAISIEIVGKIALAVLEGLTYLYDVHRIIHRDIKPSNILFNSKGQIKICDFGVSGELIDSIANTFVGTSTYMSPERIQGAPYTVKSDVWSLGISLIELALGRFPFADSSSDEESDSDLENTLSPGRPGSAIIQAQVTALPNIRSKTTSKKDKRKSRGVSLQGGGMTMSILELLQHIVNEDAPRLTPEEKFPTEATSFVNSCLLKDPDARPAPKDLLKHEWIIQSRAEDVDLEGWAATLD